MGGSFEKGALRKCPSKGTKKNGPQRLGTSFSGKSGALQWSNQNTEQRICASGREKNLRMPVVGELGEGKNGGLQAAGRGGGKG